ncbi:MAG: hypothetical protein C3F11_18235 [Methylocystaceae bacterium]|nr:MAG: hypothetical protein C3F11_18235 [Methylocystaceae bacterium]
MRRNAKLWVVIFLLVSHSLFASGAGAVDAVAPENDEPWDAGAGFSFDAGTKKKEDKARRSASGVACRGTIEDRRVCLVAFDEGVEARFIVVRRDAYEIDKDRVTLANGRELDAEGAAADRKYYYVTGSHSRKRRNCEENRDSRQVIRFAFDPLTGKASRTSSGALDGYAASDRLWPLLESLPEFREHVDKQACERSGSKEKGDVDIEGLAVADGRLYFGFRSPAKDRKAYVLSVTANALFGNGALEPAVTKIEVGEGRGVRDLQAVEDGFLVLAGPDDGTDNAGRGWVVGLWDRKKSEAAEFRKLARLDLTKVKLRECDKEIKLEALAVLEDDKDHYRILILSDGMCDGGPLTFRIPR